MGSDFVAAQCAGIIVALPGIYPICTFRNRPRICQPMTGRWAAHRVDLVPTVCPSMECDPALKRRHTRRQFFEVT